MTSRKRKFETPLILSDLPLEQRDAAQFHFDEFAITLARLIADKETRTPLAIGISGAWGAGKTSLLRRIRQQLDKTQVLFDPGRPAILDFVNAEESPQGKFRACRTVWFNAWKYADEDELLVALVRVIVQSMADDGVVNKVIGKLLDPAYPRRDVVGTVLSWFSIKIADVGLELNTGDPKETRFGEKTATLDLFDEAFDRLMAAWVHQTLDMDKIDPEKGVLVVFIDDLDRCLPEKAVQVLEAVKLFLDKTGCVFVLGADAEVVRAAVESYYQNAKVTGQNAADYLEKIIQLRFNLPPVEAGSMQLFLQGQKLEGEMLEQWQTLIAAAEINPRRVKAVINDVELQWKMLVNSGQAESVRRDDFIRWSALMRAAPENFKERVYKIDDLDLRLKFVGDALLWGSGGADETIQRQFQEYQEDSYRLRSVLRQIGAFSAEFDGETLDAFLHLSAPPQRPAPPPEKAEAKPVDVEAGISTIESEVLQRKEARLRGMPEEQKKAMQDVLEYAQKGVSVSGNRLEIGGMQFIKIPAGKFLMGSKDENSLASSNEKPQHTLDLPEFYMALFPVTNADYARFVGADFKIPEGKENHPVVEVSWQDAMKYVNWLNETIKGQLPDGYVINLPTEAQWEKAARGEYGNEWPWGNDFDKNKCNSSEGGKGGTTPVDAYPAGASPYGVLDMVGNVWEWTHSLFKSYPYKIDDGREDESDSGSRVLRGGAFNSSLNRVRCACRLGYDPRSRLGSFGFRVVASRAPEKPVSDSG